MAKIKAASLAAGSAYSLTSWDFSFMVEVLTGAAFFTTLKFLSPCHHQEVCHWLTITPFKCLLAGPLERAAWILLLMLSQEVSLKTAEPLLDAKKTEPIWYNAATNKPCLTLFFSLSKILFFLNFLRLYVEILAKYSGTICKWEFLSTNEKLVQEFKQKTPDFLNVQKVWQKPTFD